MKIKLDRRFITDELNDEILIMRHQYLTIKRYIDTHPNSTDEDVLDIFGEIAMLGYNSYIKMVCIFSSLNEYPDESTTSPTLSSPNPDFNGDAMTFLLQSQNHTRSSNPLNHAGDHTVLTSVCRAITRFPSLSHESQRVLSTKHMDESEIRSNPTQNISVKPRDEVDAEEKSDKLVWPEKKDVEKEIDTPSFMAKREKDESPKSEKIHGKAKVATGGGDSSIDHFYDIINTGDV